MQETGESFEVALATTRAGNLFTTHTAVAAGFDRFAPAFVEQYLGRYAKEKLGYRPSRFARHGTAESERLLGELQHGLSGHPGERRGEWREPFAREGQSSNSFESLFPRWPVDEVPVGYVTNGIHTPTWDSAEADDLWTEACGKDRWLGDDKGS